MTILTQKIKKFCNLEREFDNFHSKQLRNSPLSNFRNLSVTKTRSFPLQHITQFPYNLRNLSQVSPLHTTRIKYSGNLRKEPFKTRNLTTSARFHKWVVKQSECSWNRCSSMKGIVCAFLVPEFFSRPYLGTEPTQALEKNALTSTPTRWLTNWVAMYPNGFAFRN